MLSEEMAGFGVEGDVVGKVFSGGLSHGGGGNGGGGGGGKMKSCSLSASFLWDSGRRGESVKASEVVGKEVVEAKATMAQKSHSEAERRRRERINRHLATLSGLVPCTSKRDKASLLAEVINTVKELKRKTEVLTEGCVVPTDFDEVLVEYDDSNNDKEALYIKASICCDDRPDLWKELQQMLKTLQLKIVSAETTSLGSRVKNVFVMTPEETIDDAKRRSCAESVQQALKSILERVASVDFSPRSTTPSKRHRNSAFDSSSSSS